MRILITGLVAATLPFMGSFSSAAEDEGKQEKQADGVIAVVLGKEVKESEREELSRLIIRPLMNDFVVKNKIEPTKEQVDRWMDSLNELIQNEPEGAAVEDAAGVEAATREAAHEFIKSWLTQKALHQVYGGRVAFQQAGMEAIDATFKYLKERERAGDFQIFDEQASAEFWDYFTNDQRHHYLNEKDSAECFDVPMWEMEAEDEKE